MFTTLLKVWFWNCYDNIGRYLHAALYWFLCALPFIIAVVFFDFYFIYNVPDDIFAIFNNAPSGSLTALFPFLILMLVNGNLLIIIFHGPWSAALHYFVWDTMQRHYEPPRLHVYWEGFKRYALRGLGFMFVYMGLFSFFTIDLFIAQLMLGSSSIPYFVAAMVNVGLMIIIMVLLLSGRYVLPLLIWRDPINRKKALERVYADIPEQSHTDTVKTGKTDFPAYTLGKAVYQSLLLVLAAPFLSIFLMLMQAAALIFISAPIITIGIYTVLFGANLNQNVVRFLLKKYDEDIDIPKEKRGLSYLFRPWRMD